MNLLNEAFNHLDTDILEDYIVNETYKKRRLRIMRIKRIVIPVLAAAAGFLLFIGISWALRGRKTIDTLSIWKAYDMASGNNETQSTEHISRYTASFEDAQYQDYVSSRVCLDSFVGEKIQDVTMKACWVTGSQDDFVQESEEEVLKAEVYEYKDVDPKLAVVVRFLDKGEALTTDHNYVYVNSGTVFSSLEDFFETFGTKDAMTLTPENEAVPSVLEEKIAGKGINILSYKIREKEKEALKERLASQEGSLPVNTEENALLSECKDRITLQLGMESAGFYGNLKIYESGYVKLRLAGSVYELEQTFSLGNEGKQTASQLIKDILSRSEQVSSDEIIVETTKTP